MGLDAVEIVMRAEEIFGIDLPDEDCARADTVGEFYSLVLGKLALPEQGPHEIEEAGAGCSRLLGRSYPLGIGSLEPWSSADVWKTLKAIIQDQLQIDSDEITPEARFVDDLGCE